MSYSDIRVFLGLETKSLTSIGSQIEIGYVFRRYIRLTSTNDDFDLGDTLMLRAALNYSRVCPRTGGRVVSSAAKTHLHSGSWRVFVGLDHTLRIFG